MLFSKQTDKQTDPDVRSLLLEKQIRHVAIIMDGNRRWAKERHLPTVAGHAQGVQALKNIVTHADEIGLEVLTVYAFSTENWHRSQDEVGYLLKLFLQALNQELETLHRKEVRLRFIGDLSPFPEVLKALLIRSMQQTAENKGLLFQVGVNYGSRAELTRVARLLAEKVQQGQLQPSDITETHLDEHLYTAGTPDPDLLIRTGGEYRISNYLLWQCAYTELFVSSLYWPAFTPKAFNQALYELAERDRRFGR